MQIFQVAESKAVSHSLDLNELIVKHPAATFFVRVEDASHNESGIQTGDTLVVDRALKPSPGKVVLAIVDGEFTLRKCVSSAKGVAFVPLVSQDKKHKSIDCQIWGVVTFVIKAL